MNQPMPAPHRVYSNEEIDEFLEEDRLPEEIYQEAQRELSAFVANKEKTPCAHFSPAS